MGLIAPMVRACRRSGARSRASVGRGRAVVRRGSSRPARGARRRCGHPDRRHGHGIGGGAASDARLRADERGGNGGGPACHRGTELAGAADPVATHDGAAGAAGRLAGTMRDAARTGDVRAMATRRRRERWPNLVVLCDISGSMSAYSRAVLQFVHAVANRKGQGWAKVHAFTFGTRLTNITRHLAERDVDAALAAAGQRHRTGRGDADRELSGDVQPRLVAPGDGTGRSRDSDHGRAGP